MFIRKPPMFTTVRVNTSISNRDTLIEELSTALQTVMYEWKLLYIYTLLSQDLNRTIL